MLIAMFEIVQKCKYTLNSIKLKIEQKPLLVFKSYTVYVIIIKKILTVISFLSVKASEST